ncbi:LAFE_0D08570g1_1 [Lachancea fermentati]|uniref:LAFE_0D08570g1_1 n=1 Tax=Lachancea fermentati TaxID=4955 RepID=A0A1G4MBQ4_LACFM|nr:LAFE_0D08570g1_1 [Lachancea fermentati]
MGKAGDGKNVSVPYKGGLIEKSMQQFEIGSDKDLNGQKGVKLYNQVAPITLGQRKNNKAASAGRKKEFNEQEKTALLQRIIRNDQTQINPSGLREFVLGCFQLAEQRKMDVSSQTKVLQELKDIIGKAYAEEKAFKNDWWSQTIPSLSKKSSRLELLCDVGNDRHISSGNFTPNDLKSLAPPPPPPVDMPHIPPPPPAMSSSMNYIPTNSLRPTQRGILLPEVGHPKGRQNLKGSKVSSEEAERRRKRMERFSDVNSASKKLKSATDENYANLNAISTNYYKFDKNKPVVGRCHVLEKKYLRLTSEPNPDLVRPLNILKKAFDMVLEKYEKEEATYQYLCDQFKSIRQDLRVQIIENRFTLKVFQTHARIALENGDIGEFNQCQSRLKQLFEVPTIKKSNLEEFVSYRILYYLMMNNHDSINELKLKYMAPENMSVYKHPVVQHSLKMAHALLVGNYHVFFKLYDDTNGPTRCLLDAFIERERLRALNTICRSYNQLSLGFLFKELHFPKLEDGISFLRRFDLKKYIVVKSQKEPDDHAYLDTKSGRHQIVQQFEKSRKVDIKGQI